MNQPNPPGPPGEFLLGSLRPFRQDPPNFMVAMARQYGDIVMLKFGPYKAYLIANPDLVREVLVAQASCTRLSSTNRFWGNFWAMGF